MAREISIHEVAQDVLRAELRHVVHYFRGMGYDWCELEFGWHWGMDYPAEEPWATLHVALAEVESEVRKPEAAELGELGHDDVTIRVPPVDCEFLFCHHWGIHLTSSRPSQVTEDFLSRWTLAGLAPEERECPPSP